MVFLTLMSYLFYGWWDYRFCSLLLISTVVDYMAGRRISVARTKRGRKGWLLVSLVTNLSLLGFFKYFDLLARSLNQVAAWSGFTTLPSIPVLGIVLPVGISFYTFQSMSYSIDIYQGKAVPARGFWSFACYVSLFPQLIAGPIVRYHELADQLVSRTHTTDKFARGVCFFIIGLAKKVIIADAVALLVDPVFNMSAPGFCAAWVGVIAYAMQIYFDFSGYSDMAIGLGSMLGFEFPQNFNSPYKAVSITDFWHRWHMSLSRWLRDYLYIPLGGNRKGEARTYANLLMTMLLGGLWHGASWTFVLWGGYHGALLAMERLMGKRSPFVRMPRAVQVGGTFILVLIGWVLFRSSSMVHIGRLLAGMSGFNGLLPVQVVEMVDITLPWIILLISLFGVWCFPNTWSFRWRFTGWLIPVFVLLFVLNIMIILVNQSSPFLYFQF
jgi:alginate O-acetyltransferase complex protein AlgI